MSIPTPRPYAIFTRHLPIHHPDFHGAHQGHDLVLPKPANTTRCEFRNVNGISYDQKGNQFRDVFEQERDIDADIFGLSETKLNQQNPTVSKLFHQSARKTFGMNHIGTLGGSEIPYSSTIRYGGTLTMAVNDLRGRVLNKVSDPWGRWTYLELQAKGNRKILYITAYQVCTSPTYKTGSTAYHQQEAMARLEHRPLIQPRRNFQYDLRKLIK
jgi:hypothetical protein